MNNIVNFKLSEEYSITSSKSCFMPTYLPLNNSQRNTGIIFHKTEDEIQELKVSKIYKTKDEEYRISSIPMDCKTDESILLALLSENKQEFSISIKELAIKIGVNKRQATAKNVKERIMNSINKHRTFDFTLLKGGMFHTGFSILSYTFDMPKKDYLTIFFDKQFLNLYQSSNNSIINLNKYLSLKSEYSKLIYSMINNFGSSDKFKESIIYPDVFRKRLNNINQEGKTTKITPQQRQKINNALKELKEENVLKTYRFNKNDSLVFKISPKVLYKLTTEEKVMEIENNDKTSIATKIQQLKEQLKLTKGVVEYSLIEENIKAFEEELFNINNPKQEVIVKKENIEQEVDLKEEKIKKAVEIFEEEMKQDLLKDFGTSDAEEIFNICNEISKIKVIKK